MTDGTSFPVGNLLSQVFSDYTQTRIVTYDEYCATANQKTSDADALDVVSLFSTSYRKCPFRTDTGKQVKSNPIRLQIKGLEYPLEVLTDSHDTLKNLNATIQDESRQRAGVLGASFPKSL